MKRIVILSMVVLSLTGCANSQQLAQRHWDWLNSNGPGIAAGYSSGVNISNITVNGTGYTVVTPAR